MRSELLTLVRSSGGVEVVSIVVTWCDSALYSFSDLY